MSPQHLREICPENLSKDVVLAGVWLEGDRHWEPRERSGKAGLGRFIPYCRRGSKDWANIITDCKLDVERMLVPLALQSNLSNDQQKQANSADCLHHACSHSFRILSFPAVKFSKASERKHWA